jgi:hypothetical protein
MEPASTVIFIGLARIVVMILVRLGRNEYPELG